MLERIVTGLVMLAGFGFSLWMMKRWLIGIEKAMGEIKKAMGTLEGKHQTCRDELPGRFAEKKSVDKLWERTDEHEKDIEYNKGLRNGVKA